MRKLKLDLASETVEKIKTGDEKQVEVVKAFKMNVVVVGSGDVMGTIEVSDGGYLFLNMSTGLSPDIVKRVILKLTQGGTIELPEIPQEQIN